MIANRAWPLFDRFPALATLPRVQLREGPTPVERVESVSTNLWIKRDDLTALPIGGNKARSLEFLLGDVVAGERVTTVGSRGSTHALSTAIHARALGAKVTIGTWPQEMNPIAEVVARELAAAANDRRAFANAPLALSWLWWRAMRGDRAIPAGGTSPLGILGHVNAALELSEQVKLGLLPPPARVVVPFGTGGTAAGLALGFGIAGMRPRIIAARVVPKIVGRKGRVVRLARATAALIERHTGERLPQGVLGDVIVVDGVFGGAYGRPLDGAAEAANRLRITGVALDPTYAAKAFVAALREPFDGPTLFWLTFDARWITSGL